MLALPWPTWRRLIIWFVIGMVVYFSYGVRHSRLARPTASRNASPDLWIGVTESPGSSVTASESVEPVGTYDTQM
jgi:hypothetical protein